MFEEYDGVQIRVNIDQFNSEHFGIQMGNMDISLTNQAAPLPIIIQAIRKGIHDSKKEGIEHLACKMDTNCKHIVYALQKNDFLLVNTLMTYYFDFDKCRCPEFSYQCRIGDCQEKDLPVLKEIARTSFRFDRFHSDPTLPNNLCDQYYEKWIENSYYGFADKIIVAYLHDKPAGFATAKYMDKDACIRFVIAAVAPEARGKGVFGSMRYAKMQWAAHLAKKDPRIKGIFDGTQVNNLGIQRTCISGGFTIYGSQYEFHRQI